MTITELFPSSAEEADPLSRYAYIKAPQQPVFPGISEVFGRHQEAIYNSGAVAVLAAFTEWEKFVLAGSFDVRRTMQVGGEERVLRQYMALYCAGLQAGKLQSHIFTVEDNHTLGLEEPQLAAIGLPAMERREQTGLFHNGCFSEEIPHHAISALRYHAHEILLPPAVVSIDQVA